MLDYTKVAIKKTMDDFKRVDYIRNIATQLLYIAYLIYAVCTKTGFIWVDVTLLVLSAAYFAFFMVMTRGKPLQPVRKTQKFVAVLFRRCKQLLKLFNLGIMLYGIYFTTQRVTPFSVILSAMLIVGWLLQIVFEVLFRILISRAQLLLEGLEADIEELTRPAKAVGNFFKKMTGKEVAPPKGKSKNRLWLDEQVKERRIEKKEGKRLKKEERKQAKRDAKQAKIAAKRDSKNTVFLSPVKETLPAQSVPVLTEVEEPPLLLPGDMLPTKKQIKQAQKLAKKQAKAEKKNK